MLRTFMVYKLLLAVLIPVIIHGVSFAHVNLDSPKGGESYFPRTEINITWTETQEHGENNWDLYYSLDGGENWVEIALDIADETYEYTWKTPVTETSNAKVKVVQDNSGTDYEGVSLTFSISNDPPDGGTDPEIITVIENENSLLDDGLLLNNYPNPFYTSTTIQFYIPRKSLVQINIFNINGELIFSGGNKIYDKGEHKFLWKSQGFPDGLYFCRLTVGSKEKITKMILRI